MLNLIVFNSKRSGLLHVYGHLVSAVERDADDGFVVGLDLHADVQVRRVAVTYSSHLQKMIIL
jgi:hypothetical protein